MVAALVDEKLGMGMLVKATRAFFHVGDVSHRLAIEAAEKLGGREGERERGRDE